jgi:hypothetical protein
LLILLFAVAVNAVFEGAGGAGVEDGVVFSGDDVCVAFFGHGVGISVVFVPTFGTGYSKKLRNRIPKFRDCFLAFGTGCFSAGWRIADPCVGGKP